MTESPSLARRVAAVAVGLFAVWELIFLPAANVIDLIPRRPGPNDLYPTMDPYQEQGTFTSFEPLQRGAELAGDVLDFWSEVTGQEQGWKLFAAGNPPHSLFPALELRFADGEVVEIRSPYEPADLSNPLPRPPMIHDRLFNYEATFTNPGTFCCPESLARYPEMWSRGLPETVCEGQAQLLTWLKWHLKQFQSANPDRGMPAEVVLKYRYIPTPLPTELRAWTKPVIERPYARWKLGSADPAFLPVEGFDPVNGVYVRFPAEGGR